jgi:tRNA-specific 2-thiouridylase
MSERVVVAMSGGVDSSVAAAVMKKRGYEVVGLTMQLSSSESRCCSEQDVYDAKRVAKALNIPHYVVAFKEDFQREVIDYFIEEYIRGRTPNPCAVCNRKIKFGVLLQKALSLGARTLVTGHYATIARDSNGRWMLKRGREKSRDQSYFLARLTQEQLARSCFPIGSYGKRKIRQMAEAMNLPVAQKSDSQEICFIPETGVAAYIETKQDNSSKSGKIMGSDGTELGKHSGIYGYTIGQRKGLGISSDRPLYVTKIDALKNTVTVGDDHELYQSHLSATDLHWIAFPELVNRMQVRTRIRYRHRPALSMIEMTGPDRLSVCFSSPQRAITPGQLAVFYKDDLVIGSGWIENS